jgi:hypothetical protein
MCDQDGREFPHVLITNASSTNSCLPYKENLMRSW